MNTFLKRLIINSKVVSNTGIGGGVRKITHPSASRALFGKAPGDIFRTHFWNGGLMTRQDLKELIVIGFLWVIFGTIITFGVMDNGTNSPDPQWMMYHQGAIVGESHGKEV